MSSRVMHFWTGSRIACGVHDAERSTEAADWVRCKRCIPAARRFMIALHAEEDAHAAKRAAERAPKED